ncbi:DUF177 domain-containing protein [Sphingomonas sp. SUN039]|uniref:DUF177 domain-containing protein n=1 Tax=Sphingomonas sp. SUN039 TaxID=2937787 RepID=UPI0021640894|nr:DUF177 domain-containing protein [Sphingomonas sp. SUN039]UVO55134.1 DUF177 domain-containing protein [Sphingomonas sp. SUN039]
MKPEFSRRYPLDTIGSAPREVCVEATAAERAALATRFGLEALEALGATAVLTACALGIEAVGRLRGDVVQSCVVTGEPVAARIDEAFALRFVDPALLASEAEETELSDGDCDLIEIDGGAVDLGEAVAQTLGLALDPFPRCAVERAREKERKWAAGADAGPFAGLKGMLGNQ